MHFPAPRRTWHARSVAALYAYARRRDRLGLLDDFTEPDLGQPPVVSDEPDGRVRAVLGLTHKVTGHEIRVGGRIRDAVLDFAEDQVRVSRPEAAE